MKISILFIATLFAFFIFNNSSIWAQNDAEPTLDQTLAWLRENLNKIQLPPEGGTISHEIRLDVNVITEFHKKIDINYVTKTKTIFNLHEVKASLSPKKGTSRSYDSIYIHCVEKLKKCITYFFEGRCTDQKPNVLGDKTGCEFFGQFDKSTKKQYGAHFLPVGDLFYAEKVVRAINHVHSLLPKPKKGLF